MTDRTGSTVESERIVTHRAGEPRSGAKYVLYWMQSSQRPWDNPALDLAIEQANRLRLPLLAAFALTHYPEATLRHYTFMLEGLAQTHRRLAARGIPLLMKWDLPWRFAASLAKEAALVVCDGAYLRPTTGWRTKLAESVDCPVYEVESDVVVPVRAASDKREFAARTIRKKLHARVDDFLREPPKLRLRVPAEAGVSGRSPAPGTDLSLPKVSFAGYGDLLDPSDPAGVLAAIRRAGHSIDESVHPVSRLFPGGPEVALERFSRFLEERFGYYSDHRNQPHTDDTSGMSMYLQYGQVSPIRLLIEARRQVESHRAADREHRGEQTREHYREQYDDFFEELLVRRELAYNYCHYEPCYDSYDALPEWARKTLDEHAGDERETLYSMEQLEAGRTSDEYWNACMKEMRETGYMHNYVRMYWGKRVLMWSATPREAFARLLSINNRYFLDGLNPASYANVGWIFGLHDRPWTERAVYGKVRIMTPGGLKRKCNMPAYIEKVDRLARLVHS